MTTATHALLPGERPYHKVLVVLTTLQPANGSYHDPDQRKSQPTKGKDSLGVELDAGSRVWVLVFLIPKPVTLNSTLSPRTNEPMVCSPEVSQSDGTRVWHIQYAIVNCFHSHGSAPD